MCEGHVEVVRLLLSNGANVNDKDDDGKTALMYSVEGGKEMNILK